MKRIFSFLLAAFLLLGLMACAAETVEPAPEAESSVESADCGTEPAEDVSTEPEPAPATEPEVETTTSAFDATADTEMPKGFAEGSEYPICEYGEVVIEAWRAPNNEKAMQGDVPYGDNYALAKIEEVTGVQVDWKLFSSSSYSTQLSLMFASEDYPDIANVIGYNYNGGWQAAIDDDIIVDLAQHEDYIPNYMRWVNLSEGNRKNAYTDQGSMPTFGMIYNRAQSAWYGYLIRQNWLDDLGLAMPETLEEWDTTLRAFKEQKTNGAAPLDLNAGGTHMMSFIEGAFNLTSEGTCGIVCVDDVLHSSYRDQGLYDYLELLSGWYDDGLIDPDFTSVAFMWNSDRMSNNESGVVPGMYTQAGNYAAMAGMAPEGTYLSLMPMPTTEGYERKIYHNGKYSSGLASNGSVVFADSEYIEETMRWIDYRFSEDGYMLSNYGIEGVTFDYNENGEPMLYDFITQSPDGFGGAMDMYLIHNGTVVFLLEREESQVNEEGKKYNDLWGNRGEWNFSGSLSLTVEESEERGGLVSDISTYVSEFMVKVIMGMIDLNDQTWNEFQEQLTAMNLDRVVEITQQAYNRYLQR